jgi:S1-C subfamily serine protease
MKLALILLTVVLACLAPAQDEADYPALPRAQYRSGQAVLNAFAPIAAQTRHSVVEFNVNGSPVALGAIIDSNGLALTKASELSAGKLTCWLATGKEAQAELLAVDEDEDVALVRVKADGLKPLQWASTPSAEGQWVITPCLADTPLAVGIVSAQNHRIAPMLRAFIGVMFNPYATPPTVRRVSRGFGAEKAGIKPGDIFVSVDGRSVTNSEQVREILQEFRDGQSVRIRFRREAREFEESIEVMAPRASQEDYDLFTNEADDDLSGNVSVRSGGFDQALEHDTVLEPWQCGGPLVNLDGKVVGLNIARANRISTYALPASLARQIAARLKAKAEKR